MEDDTDVLDWGNEDDEPQTMERLRQVSAQDIDDAEDAVSLGGDEDEEFYASRTATQDHSIKRQLSTSKLASQQPSQSGKQRENSGSTQKSSPRKNESSQENTLRRSQSLATLIHALPPKPSVAPPPPIPDVTSQTTLASSMIRRDGRRQNGRGRSDSLTNNDAGEKLPPDWEARHSRNGGKDPYYYNVKTHESTWTRPVVAASRRSPTKERTGGDVYIPDSHSPEQHSDGNTQVPRSARKEGKRKSSPVGNVDSLSHEDRYWRPTEPLESDNVPDRRSERDSRGKSHTESPRMQTRALSPRRDDRRRSLTPPPRRAARKDQLSRGRRDSSPTSVQDSRRVARQSPIQERAWGRARSPESSSGRANDTSQRRRSPLPHPQDTRSDSRNEWPASRHRSPPPHIQEQSLPRRALTPPPTSDRFSMRSGDAYVAPDIVPRRRTRDNEGEDNNAGKRRRTDESSDISSDTRTTTADRRLFASLPERPASQYSPVESSHTRKRQPLPPQSDRFLEASRTQRTNVRGSSSASAAVQSPSDVSSRVPTNASIPSGPRSQAQQPSPRDPDSDRGSRSLPAHISSRGRSRFDNPADHLSVSDRDRDPEPMSVDHPSPEAPLAIDRAVSESQMGTVPKGPRAMARNSNGHPSQSVSSGASSALASGRAPPQELALAKISSGRAPPPHLSNAPAVSARGGLPQGPKGLDDHSDVRRLDTRDASVRGGRRDGPLPLPRLSGANDVPIGNRRAYSGGPGSGSEPVTPIDRPRDLPPANAVPSGRYDRNSARSRADYDRAGTPPLDSSVSPTAPYRGLPTLPESGARHGHRNEHLEPPQSSRNHGSENGARQLRSGLNNVRPQEARIWLTREESLGSGLAKMGLQALSASPYMPPVEPKRRNDAISRQHSSNKMDVDPPSNQRTRSRERGRGRTSSLEKYGDQSRGRGHKRPERIPASWDRPSDMVVDTLPIGPAVLIDRSVHLDRQPPPTTRGPSPSRDDHDEHRPSESDVRREDMPEPFDSGDIHQRPDLRRGTSLLDRLALDNPPSSRLVASSLLRARVELPPKPTFVVAMPPDADGDSYIGTDDGAKGGRRRRSGKPRKPRRN